MTTAIDLASDVTSATIIDTFIEKLFDNEKDPVKATAEEHGLTKKILQTELDDPTSELRLAISTRISTILSNTDIEKYRAFEELKEIAFSNLTDFVEIVDGELRYTNWDSIDRKKLAALQEVRISHNQFGSSIQIKLHNKMSAIDSLSKIVKLMELPANNSTYIYNDNRLFSNIEEAKELPAEVASATVR